VSDVRRRGDQLAGLAVVEHEAVDALEQASARSGRERCSADRSIASAMMNLGFDSLIEHTRAGPAGRKCWPEEQRYGVDS
jgi:hypothetical protein